MAKQRFRDLKQGRKSEVKEKEKKVKLSGFARKGDIFKAILTDSFMLLMPVWYIVFYAVFGGGEGISQHKLQGWLYIFTLLAILESIFLIKSELSQTPGMKAYNIKLIFLPTGKKPPKTTIILRQLLAKVSLVTFGWITILFRKDGRNLHDLIAGTALVYDNTKA